MLCCIDSRFNNKLARPHTHCRYKERSGQLSVKYRSTRLGDEGISNEVLFVGDENDGVAAFCRSQFLKARLCVAEGRSIRHRIDDDESITSQFPVLRLQVDE